MRDSTIITEMRKSAKTGGLLLAQFEYLKTRQEALELAEMGAPLWRRAVWAFSPARKWKFVEAIQVALLEKAEQDLAARAAKAKIQIVPGGVSPEAALNGR